MNLRKLLGEQWPDLQVSGLCEHTDEVFPGCAFFAVAGDSSVALAHAEKALADGANPSEFTGREFRRRWKELGK